MDILKLAVCIGVFLVGVGFLVFNVPLGLFHYENEPEWIRNSSFLNPRERVVAIGCFFTFAGFVGMIALFFGGK